MQTEHAPELCCGTSPDLRFAQVRDQWCFGCCRSAKPSCKVWWVLYTRFFISSLWTIRAIARFSERLLPDTKMHVLARDNQLNWVLCSCVWEIALTSSTSASYRFLQILPCVALIISRSCAICWSCALWFVCVYEVPWQHDFHFSTRCDKIFLLELLFV